MTNGPSLAMVRRWRRLLTRRLCLPWARGGVILLYHRVSAPTLDPQRLCVSPIHFAQHVEVLARRGMVKPLAEAGTPGVAITFDDGYADNLHEALPILDRHGLPATIYVTSGCLGKELAFYWDRLSALLLTPSTLPTTLTVTIAGTEHQWHLGSASSWDRAEAERYRSWAIDQVTDPTPRHRAYRELCLLLKGETHEVRSDSVSQVESQATPSSEPSDRARVLSAEELLTLSASPLIDIGAHTVTHAHLASLPKQQQRDEIINSRLSLEAVIQRPVRSFSYPFGSLADYGATAVRAVRSAGFCEACSNFPGRIHPADRPYELPRLLVRDCDGDELMRQVSRWIPAD